MTGGVSSKPGGNPGAGTGVIVLCAFDSVVVFSTRNPFIPYEYGYDFKVIITNKSLCAKKVLNYHNGRGAQEGLFAELKSHAQMDYVPTRNLAGNRVFLLCGMMRIT